MFLHDAPEFPRDILTSLRQPLQHGEMTVTRGGIAIRFPAKFTLIASTAPCPCGAVQIHAICAPQVRSALGSAGRAELRLRAQLPSTCRPRFAVGAGARHASADTTSLNGRRKSTSPAGARRARLALRLRNESAMPAARR